VRHPSSAKAIKKNSKTITDKTKIDLVMFDKIAAEPQDNCSPHHNKTQVHRTAIIARIYFGALHLSRRIFFSTNIGRTSRQPL
jgi:hypothetical protein